MMGASRSQSEFESKTSTQELWPESPKGYLEETSPLLGPAWQPPTLLFLPVKVLLPHAETSVFREAELLIRWLVDARVRLHDPKQIQEYIVKFPDLIEAVPKAVEAARNHLPGAQLALEVYRDPEIDDCYLALYVRLETYDGNMMERIEAAESEFLDRLAGGEGWLLLTTDFGKPEG